MLIKGFSFFISSGHFDEGMGADICDFFFFEIEHLAFEEMSFKDFFSILNSACHFI